MKRFVSARRNARSGERETEPDTIPRPKKEAEDKKNYIRRLALRKDGDSKPSANHVASQLLPPTPASQATTVRAQPTPSAQSQVNAQPVLDVNTALTKVHIGSSCPTQPVSRRLSSPRVSGDVFRLGELPLAEEVQLETLLAKSVRHVTIKKAAAARFSVVTALGNMRELPVLSRVVDQYVPYALTCWDIAEKLKTKGTNISNGVVWASGLLDGLESQTRFNSGFGLEASMVLVLAALSRMRDVVETVADFGMQSDETLIAQIKSLQTAAGILAYARDMVIPSAMADFVGTPPPELYPDVSAILCSLALCMAQALHVRRAAVRGMSAATLAKLSAAANDLAVDVLSKYDTATQADIKVTVELKTAAKELDTLTHGWTLQYLGATTKASENAGAKVSALRAALDYLRKASKSRFVGKAAALDLETLQKDLDDAIGENRVMYQHAIPDEKELQLPVGRSLVSATPFDAPRIPKADTAPQ